MQFLSIFRNRKTAAPEIKPETISRTYHDAIMAEKHGEIDRLASQLRAAERESESLAAELTNARRSNQASMTELMTLRFKNAELVQEIVELKPDAEAHRARLSRDRDYHRARRSLKTRALSLQPASPAMSEGFGGH